MSPALVCAGLVSPHVPPFLSVPAPAAAAPSVALTRLLGLSQAPPAAYLGKGWDLGFPACGGGVFFCPQGFRVAVGRARLAMRPLPPAPRFGLDQAPLLPQPIAATL